MEMVSYHLYYMHMYYYHINVIILIITIVVIAALLYITGLALNARSERREEKSYHFILPS